MQTRKVIFLDVDGVLNNEGVFRDKRFGPIPLDHKCIERLHNIVRETGCSIVLSSSWRGMEDLERKLDADFVFRCWMNVKDSFCEVRHADGATKRLRGDEYKGRGSEIAEWLARHPEVETYAIVDDDSDMLPDQQGRFVKTSFETGMTDEHAARLVDLLREPVDAD